MPLAVTLAAALVLKEPLGWRRFSAILIGFCGVLLIVRPGAEGFSLWSLVGLAAVGCIVARDLATRRIGSDLPAATIALWTSGAVTLLGLAGSLPSGFGPVTGGEAFYLGGAAVALMVGYLSIVLAMRGRGTSRPSRPSAIRPFCGPSPSAGFSSAICPTGWPFWDLR